MLGSLRKHSRSFMVWVLFGFLIAVFVIGFGTPASNKLACGSRSAIGRVGSHDITQEDYKYAVRLMMPEQAPPTMKAWVLDQLLRREILAQEAERMGFQPAKPVEDAADDPDVVEMISHDKVLIMGNELKLSRLGGWPLVRDSKGKYHPAKNFNYDRFKKWTMWRVGLTVPQFMRQQQRELLARQAAQTITSGVTVSEAELRAMYEQDHNALVVQTALFQGSDYEKYVWVTPAEVQEFLSKHGDDIHKLYEQKYKGVKDLPEERRLRILVLKVPKDAKDAEWTARQREAKALAQRAKPETFAELARTKSEDTETRPSGGLVGWVGKDDKRLPPEVAKAVASASAGRIVGPVRAKDGWYVAYVEAVRKGAWPEDQAKKYLAYDMLVEQKALALAKQLAAKALAQAKSKGDLQAALDALAKAGATAQGDGETDRPKTGKTSSEEKIPVPEAKEVTVRRVDATVPGLEEVLDLAPKLWKIGHPGVFDEVLNVKRAGKVAAYAVVAVKEVRKPDWKAFEKQKDLFEVYYLKIKQQDVLNAWVRQRCEELAAEGKIKIDPRYTVIRYVPKNAGEDAKPITVKYVYCRQLSAHASDALGRL